MTRTGSLPKDDSEKRSSRKPELAIRIVSAVLLAALALGAAIFSPWTFLVLVMIGAGLIIWEWGRLTRGTGFDATALLSAVAAASIAVFGSLVRPDLAAVLAAAAGAAIFFTAPSRDRGMWSVGGLVYAALPAFALAWLRSDALLGAAAVIYLFAVAWTTDTASYAAGSLIAGPKLAPKISPQKTWSGFVVGVLTPALVGIAFAFALKNTSGLRLAFVSIGLALACQIGDLVESWVKRRFGVKDMSQLIPGHGGLLDRIDGLLFAAILAALIALRDPANPGRGLLIW